MKLTDIHVQKLPLPKVGAKTYFDDTLKGFAVRVSAGGTKAFTLLHGKTRRRTALGKYPLVSLHEARSAARRLLAKETLGQIQESSTSADLAVEAYLERMSKKLRVGTYKEYSRILNGYFLGTFKGDRLDKITGRALLDRLDKLRERPSEHNHAFSVFRIFFRWCVRNYYLERSPLEAMTMPNSQRSRERVLSHDELRRIWYAAKNTHGDIVKLLALTGQRRGEIAGLRSNWINRDEQTITLPSTATKNKAQHTFPYGAMAGELLPKRTGFLFPVVTHDDSETISACFNGWSKAKRMLDETSGVQDWVIHDLRRTFATNLAELGVEPHIIEALLNHRSGIISGVAATYNRARYLRPMREAITKWERELQRILAS